MQSGALSGAASRTDFPNTQEALRRFLKSPRPIKLPPRSARVVGSGTGGITTARRVALPPPPSITRVPAEAVSTLPVLFTEVRNCSDTDGGGDTKKAGKTSLNVATIFALAERPPLAG